jgi:hypothetical protein
MHQDQNPDQPSAYNPADDGFVFSTAEIETHIHREERWQQANDQESSMHA